MQKTITPKQLKGVHTLFSKAGIKEKKDKGDVIISFTGGRTNSSRLMSFNEAEALIGHLKSMDPQTTGADKMRKKIISLAHEMNWKLESGKIDMKHINDWCKKFGYLHKVLDEYSYDELPQLVTQFESVYKDFIKKQ
jgi:hypothetical protein